VAHEVDFGRLHVLCRITSPNMATPSWLQSVSHAKIAVASFDRKLTALLRKNNIPTTSF